MRMCNKWQREGKDMGEKRGKNVGEVRDTTTRERERRGVGRERNRDVETIYVGCGGVNA